ncbi:MAG: hypothetical protein JXJ04_07230 [Spirochaetales bacterium]|nr:hypothetical protein [Spirochaetales bacterium]
MEKKTNKGGSVKMSPLEPNQSLDIPDGEYLHYVNYVDEKKHADFYLVTKREKNDKGDLLYRVHFDIINVLDNKKLPTKYTDWAAFLVIDPRIGSVIESGGTLLPNDMKNWIRIAGLTSWQYKMNNDHTLVNFNYKKSEKNKIIEKNFKIKTTPKVPTGGLWMSMFFIYRMLNIQDGRYMHLVNPFFFENSTWPFELRSMKQETVKTKAGSFDCTKYIACRGRMFPMSIFKKDFVPVPNLPYWVENSERRLVIKESTMAGNSGDYVLEDISRK